MPQLYIPWRSRQYVLDRFRHQDGISKKARPQHEDTDRRLGIMISWGFPDLCWFAILHIYIIWVNYNISLTWIKAVVARWFPLLTTIIIYIYIYINYIYINSIYICIHMYEKCMFIYECDMCIYIYIHGKSMIFIGLIYISGGKKK